MWRRPNNCAGDIQREFKGNRKKNVARFAAYLRCRALPGLPHSLPPIALWTPDEVLCDVLETRDGALRPRSLAETDVGAVGLATVHIDPTSPIIAIDGETQAAALFHLLDQLTEEQDAAGRKQLDQLPIDVQFHFSADVGWAHHAFNTRNREGIKQTGLTLGVADSDPHVWVLQSLLDANPHLKPFFDLKAREGTQAKPLTGTALLTFLHTLHVGLPGVQKGKAPKDVDGEELEQFRHHALEWFEALQQALGDKLTNRAEYVCPSPQVLAALGALGYDVLRQPDPTRRRRLDSVLVRVRAKDWRKGPHWIGIAGKAAADGSLSLAGGAKEWATRTYSAVLEEGRDVSRHPEPAMTTM